MPRKPQSAKPDSAATEGPDSPSTGELEGVSFEHAIGELEAIVEQMETGDVSLQESLASYQRGAALITHCRRSLDEVAQQVKVLENGLLKPIPADPDQSNPGGGKA